MKKTTLYLLILCLVGLLPTKKALAQDLFNCELDIALSATGTCDANTGTITIDIMNGFGHSYTIHWSNQYTRSANKTVVSSDDSYVATGLPAARYTVVVVDDYSQCLVSKQVDVVPNYVQGAITVKGQPASCNGYGAINVAIAGNAPSYFVELKGPVNASYVANSNDFSIYKLTSGDYEVIIGQGACTQTFNTTIGFAEGLPSLVLSPEEDECGIHSGNVDMLISGGVGPYTVTLDGPTADRFVASGSISTSGLTSGTYTATLVDENGCKSVAVLAVNTVALSADFSGIGESTRGSGFISVLASGGYGPYQVDYTGTISGSKMANDERELVPAPAGAYEVVVTDANGCTVAGSVTVKAGDSGAKVTGFTTNTLISKDKVQLHQNYPNPFDGQTTIRFELPQATEAFITIQDHYGRIISTNRQTYTKGLNEFVVDGSNLNAGIYFYTISTEGFNQTKRMVVQ